MPLATHPLNFHRAGPFSGNFPFAALVALTIVDAVVTIKSIIWTKWAGCLPAGRVFTNCQAGEMGALA